MNTPLVYKSLVRLASAITIFSFQFTALAGNIAKSPVPTPSSPGNILDTAEASFKAGEYDKVTELLWKNIDKLNRKELLMLAVAHEKKKEPANMLKVANMLTSKNPKDYEGFYLLGSAQLMSKKNNEALESLKTTLEINPKYRPAYEKLAEMYEKNKNNYELRILYQDMLENIGRKAEFLTKLCEINTNDNQEDQALANCKEAILKDPKVAENYVYLGLVQLHSGETEEAKKALKAAAESHSKSEFAQYTYANLLEDQKNYLESSNYYLAGTVADPKSSRCWVGYAKSSFELHKYAQALEAYKKACKLEQKTAVAFRKATTTLRNSKDVTLLKQYEAASETCSGY
ncbi:MAG: tetratricopeptide repeat protein [Pseudobdellovibrionaceae bacterium]